MKILIIHPYGIGDVLFMTPLLKAIKMRLPAERIDVILGSRTKEVLENNPNVDELFIIDKDRWRSQGKIKTWLEKRKLYTKLKARKYDILIDLSMRKEYSKWLKNLKINKRIGFNHRNRAKFLNYCLDIPDEGFKDKHAIEFYAELAQFLGIKVEDKHLEFNLSQEAIKKAQDLLVSNGISQGEKVVVVIPGSGSSWGKDAYLKQWPVENFAGLLNKLEVDFDFDTVIILGSSQETAIAEKLQQAVSRKTLNLCAKTDLATSAALIKRAMFFLGNDGGMVHIAASLDVPLIAIFGPVDPLIYGPYPQNNKIAVLYKKDLSCRPCYFSFSYKNDCLKHSCLRDFTPEEAYGQLKDKHFLKNIVN